MNNTLEMIRKLSDAPGPSGFEDAVVDIAKEYAADLGVLEEDCLRNLYIYRKENTGTKPVIMLDAHSDEVGFMISDIDIFLNQISNPEQSLAGKSKYTEVWSEYVKIAYKTNPYTEGRKYRNNN